MRKLSAALIVIVIGIIAGFFIVKNPLSGNSTNLLSPVPGATVQKESSPSPIQKPITLPVKIQIPKIGVNAEIESVGLDKQNKMDVPKLAENVAWYNLGVKPGEKGSAVMAGHLDKITGAPAVFYKLSTLTPGDKITVVNRSGDNLIFKVTRISKYPDKQFPLQEVFAGPTDTARLNLITCEGVFDQKTKNYSDRVVVYSELES